MAKTPLPMHSPLTPRKLWTVLLALLVLLVILSVRIVAGECPHSIRKRHFLDFGSSSVPETQGVIVVDVRLPRVLLAITVGAGLALAGVVLQALLRNPLAEPYILGISSGGTMGRIVAMTALGSVAHIAAPFASFVGSALVMLLVYEFAQRRSTPLDAHHVVSNFAIWVKGDGPAALERGIGAAMIAELERQMAQDIPIWENKRYLARPLLCDGDGPILRAREWMQQFYSPVGA